MNLTSFRNKRARGATQLALEYVNSLNYFNKIIKNLSMLPKII